MRWVLLGAVLTAIIGCGRPSSPSSAAPAGGKEAATAKGAAIAWNYDYQDGLAKAKQAGKPVMVDVFATWCGACKVLEEQVFSRADVAEASRAFVTVRVDRDKHRELAKKLRVEALPTVLFLTPDGEEIGRSLGAVPYQNMLQSMEKAKAKLRG